MRLRPLRRVLQAVGLAALAYHLGLRRWQLRWGATDEEATRDLPGDDLLRHPELEATRAVTIRAGPADVWPWIVQMGYGRAGFYAYDVVDNGGVPSADRIVAELQDLGVGDVMPTSPRGDGFVVQAIDPPRSLVLWVPESDLLGATGQVSSVIVLDEVAPATTRLVCRLRATWGSNLASRLYALVFEPGDFVMMRKMLLGLKERAERAAGAAPGPGAPGRARSRSGNVVATTRGGAVW